MHLLLSKFNLSRFCLALVGSQVLFIIYTLFYWHLTGRLPPPFIYHVHDTFMDFYNTNFWAQTSGRYQDWHSIYPIFTFWLGQLFSPGQCEAAIKPVILRQCSIESIWLLLGLYVIGVLITAWLAVRHIEQNLFNRCWQVLLIGFMLLMASPSLFAMERGNYILLTFTFIAMSEWMGRNWRGALLLALAINLKQYLIVLWLVPLLKRRYDYLVISIGLALIVNQLAMIFVADEHYGMLFENMFIFANDASISSFFQKMWYATSFSSWSAAIANPKAIEYLSPPIIQLLTLGIETLRWFSLLFALLSLFLVLRNAARLSWEEVSLIVLMALMMIVGSVGGYALILLFPFVVTLLQQGKLTNLLPLFFLLATPLDVPLRPTQIRIDTSYLTGQAVEQVATITLGMYLRPVLLVLLMIGLVYPLLKQHRAYLNLRNVFDKLKNK